MFDLGLPLATLMAWVLGGVVLVSAFVYALWLFERGEKKRLG